MPGPGMELVGEEEIQEVIEVLKSGYLYRYDVAPGKTGFQVKVIEAEVYVAHMSKVRYAVAVNSGTSALLTAMVGLDIGPGDEVIVPGFTFIASISAIAFTGAVPARILWPGQKSCQTPLPGAYAHGSDYPHGLTLNPQPEPIQSGF